MTGDVRPHRTLAEADAWGTRHVDLLASCFERFRQTGEWPTLEQLQHQFEIAGRDEDVSRLAFAMPRLLGFVEQQRMVLLIRALAYVPEAASLLDDWSAVLKLAYGKWRDDPEAQLTRSDVLQAFEGDPQRTRLVSRLIQRESWPFGSGHGGPDDEWSREIISAVRDARDAQGPADIIAARNRIELPPSSPPRPEVAPTQQPPAPGSFKRVWSVVSENTLIATVVGGIVVLLIGAYVIHSAGEENTVESGGGQAQIGLAASGQQPGSATAQARREQAGTRGARAFAKPAGAIEGPRIMPSQHLLVSCKVYDPEPESALPDGYWYRLASRPWNDHYYAPANSFWNGDIPGEKPYTHNTDFSVPNC